jgi:flagellar biosynthetic protein FliP
VVRDRSPCQERGEGGKAITRRRWILSPALALLAFLVWPATCWAAPITLTRALNQALSGPGMGLVVSVAFIVLGTGLFLLLTSFTRIVVVLSFVRTAVGTPTSPPNMVVVALALVLTVVTMSPTLSALNQMGHLTLTAAIQAAQGPLRHFLWQGTTAQNLGILLQATHHVMPRNQSAVPFATLAAAFAVSQLTLAFQMALLVYLPFLIIDLVVAAILMSLGMIMVPPTVVSLPLKLLLFVAVNGWGLVVGTLLASGAH